MFQIGRERIEMSGKGGYLLDSNFIIRLSRSEDGAVEFFEKIDKVAVSIITYMEVLGYNFKSAIESNMVRDIFELMEIFYIDEVIANEVIDIRKSIKIKLPYAIIAATALVNDYSLVTANIDDFKRLDELNIINN